MSATPDQTRTHLDTAFVGCGEAERLALCVELPELPLEVVDKRKQKRLLAAVGLVALRKVVKCGPVMG